MPPRGMSLGTGWASLKGVLSRVGSSAIKPSVPPPALKQPTGNPTMDGRLPSQKPQPRRYRSCFCTYAFSLEEYSESCVVSHAFSIDSAPLSQPCLDVGPCLLRGALPYQELPVSIGLPCIMPHRFFDLSTPTMSFSQQENWYSRPFSLNHRHCCYCSPQLLKLQLPWKQKIGVGTILTAGAL